MAIDYSFWLLPMSQNIRFPDYPYYAKRNYRIRYYQDIYEGFQMSGQLALIISFIFGIGYFGMTRLQKTRMGHGHLYLSIWLLCCLPTPYFINNFWVNLYLKLANILDEYYKLKEIKDPDEEVNRKISEVVT